MFVPFAKILLGLTSSLHFNASKMQLHMLFHAHVGVLYSIQWLVKEMLIACIILQGNANWTAPPLLEIWTLKEYAQGRSDYPNAFLAVPQ